MKANSLKTERTQPPQPETAEDFYDEGVSYEESGDRWFTSDLSKALRFYYRAHNSYKQALNCKPTMGDALYNLLRLEYEVYNKYIKDDSVVLDDLDNCAEALNDNKSGGLIHDIVSLCNSFENGIDILYQSDNQSLIGWDFYFNVAMCYLEYIETLCSDSSTSDNLNLNSELIKYIQRCIFMFGKVMDFMQHSLENNDENVSVEMVASVCIESYKMFSTIYETLYKEELINFMDVIMRDYLVKVDYIAGKLPIEHLPMDVAHTLKISKLNECASRELNYDNFINIWNSENQLNSVLEKQLVETSSIRSYLDKFETSQVTIPLEAKWNMLTMLSNKYRTINDVLRTQITDLERTQSSENDLLSSKISLLCSVFIERADIDVERSLLDVYDAIQNQTVLQNNCRNLLKNAIIFSKKSGGIRESMSGKLMRKKKQREAVMRLCLLDGKPQEEWNIIVGEKYWPLELKELSDIPAYKILFS